MNRFRIRITAIGGGILCCLLLPALARAGGAAGEGQMLIANIALCVVSASLLGLLMKLARQPVILGHILAGVLLGPIGLGLITGPADIATISQLGLILLLFMIGLEIDLHKMFSSGRLVILPGLLQFPFCLGFGYAIFALLDHWGLNLTQDGVTRLYFALAIAISSTMIVVKLLYEKFELDTLPGRITIGILIFQDIWAIIILALQPNMANPHIMAILPTFFSGALLVTAAFAASKYLLPRLFRYVAKLPELLLIISLGWCFLVALIAARPEVGLSMEMGALIAGVSLATFPYNLDVIAKVVSIRDFFITLFFVALGMQIPLPDSSVIIAAVIIVLVVILTRILGIFAILYSLGAGQRASILATINLSQMSEFSLVILMIGVGYGHLWAEEATPLIWVFSILAVLSTYLIMYSHPIQKCLTGLLQRAGFKENLGKEVQTSSARPHPVVLLGFYRIASAFLAEATSKHPALVEKIKVIDFNPQVKEKLDSMGVACIYGDISHPETLHHAGIHQARILICTIPDHILKGATNQRLLNHLKNICPGAKIILTADGAQQARSLYQEGADYVLQPSHLAGDFLAGLIEKGLDEGLLPLRDQAIRELADRQEVLS
ncbi:MAG: cation:proton antiporter [Smithellaceae bacterium]|nr:cation:proton antiporter [Smithellaceae bacterium]